MGGPEYGRDDGESAVTVPAAVVVTEPNQASQFGASVPDLDRDVAV
jgi:hypothetical protein